MPLSKWIDILPVWLFGFILIAWAQARWFPAWLDFGGGWADFVGGLLVGGGIVLMVLAILEFRRHQTTPEPHQTPTRMITSGIFSRSRNPIYLGDAMVLAGLILRWDAVLALLLIPIFVWVIERRFAIPEEDCFKCTFRADYARL